MPDLLERLSSALGDRYAIEREAGRGGMAVVFLAEDLKHHRRVALKVLHPELTATLGAERFLHEIEIVAGLQHPHILPLYESGEADGLLYYVMPYAEGESLRQRLDREGQLAVDESVRIAVEVADGLDYAHQKGVVHRDIKPGNILLSARHAVIADFGIARAVEAAQRDRITSTGLGVGTPLYASPEQATAQETLDGRTDIYSLGCVLYEMLAGEPPLTGSTPQMIQAKRASETPSPLHGLRDTVPPALDHVIARALARIPADRYATAAQFGQALQAVLFAATPTWTADVSATPGALSMTPTSVSGPTRRRLAVWPIVAIALSGAVAGTWFLSQRANLSDAGSEVVAPASDAFREVQLTHTGEVDLPAISPDGRYLAYAVPDAEGTTRRVVLRDLESQQPERSVAVLDGLRNLNWLPDGSALILRGSLHGEFGFYSVAHTGGVLRPVPSKGVYSPDGREMLDWDYDRPYLFVLSTDPDRVDGYGQPERLDSIPISGKYVHIADAQYSPDGEWLAVSVRRHTSWLRAYNAEGVGALLIVDRDSKEQRVLVEGVAARSYSVRWRSDGRALFYTAQVARERFAVMRLLIASNGVALGEPEVLLETASQIRSSYVTGDGLKLVITRRSSDERLVWLRRSSSDSTFVEPIVGTEGMTAIFMVSPDGRTVAFLKRGALGLDLFTVPIEGGRPRQLTTSGSVSDFGWSPDSRILAYSARRGDAMGIWLVPASGGSPTPLLGSPVHGHIYWNQGPLIYRRSDASLWVADSLRVRVGSDLLPMTPGNLELPGGEVGATARPLATNDSLGIILRTYASPDGDWVIARWRRSDHPGVWKFSLVDSEQTLVLEDTRSSQYQPIFLSPDGTAVYYWTQGGIPLNLELGDWGLLVKPVEGGELRSVMSPPETGGYLCDPYFAEDDVAYICTEVAGTTSDAWLIENFDPHVN